MDILEIVLVVNSGILLLGLFYIIRTFNRERKELIAALLAKSLPEYAMSLEKLKTTPKDKLKQMKIENDLAIANEKMFRQHEENGITVT